jgi:hypothetical protein
MAETARRTKSRFAGGTWKLYVLYRGLREPAGGLKASEEEWNQHLDRLGAWAQQSRESVTARVALAEAFFRYAEKERALDDASRRPGAEPLQEDPWAVIHDRLHAAQLALKDASEMPTKCPHWYFVTLELEGRPSQALFDEAVAFEPDYYPYYRLQAMLLLVTGAGDASPREQKLAETASQGKSDEGKIIYYQIAATLNGNWETKQWPMVQLPWERVQEGFEASEKKYGTSLFLQNQFALIAFRAHKHEAAKQQFIRIGQNWDEQTWGTRAYFENSRKWALAPPAIAGLWQITVANEAADGGFADRTQKQLVMKTLDQFRKCAEPLGQDLGPYFDIFVRLDGSGAVAKAEAWPPTKLGQCYVPSLHRATASAPPKNSYWVRLPIGTP